MTKMAGEDVRFRVLLCLSRSPELSQRMLSEEVGVSLGCVNYCLKALAETGLIKIRNFQKSEQKMKYAYILTPKGLQEKTALAARFFQRKTAEYERLQEELESLAAQMRKADGGAEQ